MSPFPNIGLDQYAAMLSSVLAQLPVTMLKGRVVPARRVVSRLGYLPAILIGVDQTCAVLSGHDLMLTLEPEPRGEMGVFVTGDLPYPASIALLCSTHLLRQNLSEDGQSLKLDPIVDNGLAALATYGLELPVPSASTHSRVMR